MAKYGRRINWTKTVKGFSDALGYAGEHLTGWAKMWMDEAVDHSLAQIDSKWGHETVIRHENANASRFGGDQFHPWYTGNLHDSVAGVVSDRNRIVSIRYMPSSAVGVQEYKGEVIIGRDCAEEAARKMTRTLHMVPGIVATVVIGVPYADDVEANPRHTGYKRELSTQFSSNVEDYFTIKAGEGYRTRAFVADNKKKR
jgi:hypothetical protein